MSGFGRAILLLALIGQARADQPVGVVLAPGGSKLLRANTETPLAARSGDLLFSGDGLRTEASAASFLFCPAKSVDTLSPSGEVRFDPKQPKVKIRQNLRTAGASLHASRNSACSRRQPAALRRHHDARHQTRGSAHPAQSAPRRKCWPNFRRGLTKDPATWSTAATVFEKHKLIANALDAYYKLREQWPDAVWVKSKIFDLEQTLWPPRRPRATGRDRPTRC